MSNIYKTLLKELSSNLEKSAISKMKDRGMDRRAEKWEKYHIQRDFRPFIGKFILNGKYEIRSISKPIDDMERRSRELDHLYIAYSSPSHQRHNIVSGKIVYDIERDRYLMSQKVDRATARILSKIAQQINPDTQYKNGVGDFKIEGWHN